MNIAIVSNNLEKSLILGRILGLYMTESRKEDIIEMSHNELHDTFDDMVLIPSNYLEKEVSYALAGTDREVIKAYVGNNISDLEVEKTFERKIHTSLINAFGLENILNGIIKSFSNEELIICGIKDETTRKYLIEKGYILIGFFVIDENSLFKDKQDFYSEVLKDTIVVGEDVTNEELVDIVMNDFKYLK